MTTFTSEDAKQIGDTLNINWETISLKEYTMGINVELEHGSKDPETDVTHDDRTITGKIAWAHLKEFPDYYTRLKKLETAADKYWKGKEK